MAKQTQSELKRIAKRQAFVREYLRTLNGRKAAIAAGYSAKRAMVTASELMADAEIRGQIARAIHERHGITASRIIEELAAIAFHRPTDYFQWADDGVSLTPSSELSPEQSLVIAEVRDRSVVLRRSGEESLVRRDVLVKLQDKLSALGMLAKLLGFPAERDHPLTQGPVTFVIEGLHCEPTAEPGHLPTSYAGAFPEDTVLNEDLD